MTITIRPAQIQAFQNAADAGSNSRLAAYARKRFEAEFSSVSEDALLGFVAAIREGASQHGITEIRDIGTAIDLTVMYGREFYDAEWAKDVFDIQDWDGTQKMDAMRLRVRRQVPEF